MDPINARHIHFIGIGGIGVSAIAHIMLFLGKKVSGSDLAESQITGGLSSKGAQIFLGKHSSNHVQHDVDLIIYSNAVTEKNPEFTAAKKRNIPLYSYPEILGELLKKHIPIIVSGTHGKSTTTAMLASIFIKAKLDPWVVMGTMMNFDGMQENAHIGLGRHMIVEGDEYRAAFLHYHPFALIINNIETDHLDFYKTFGNILKTFKMLVAQIPSGGIVVANADDPSITKLLPAARCKVVTFGLNTGDYQATHIVQHGELTRFAVKGLECFDIALKVPGQHNVKNALAAAVMSLFFGIPIEMIRAALLEFPGVWRRFEVKAEIRGSVIIDDYAHHPTEIKATLSTARSLYPNKKIWCIFQPHSLDRTTYLFEEFANAFVDCDQVILTDIYQVAGRDSKQFRTIEELEKAIRDTGKSVKLLKTDDEILKYCKKIRTGEDVFLTVGAGTITQLNDQLVKKLK